MVKTPDGTIIISAIASGRSLARAALGNRRTPVPVQIIAGEIDALASAALASVKSLEAEIDDLKATIQTLKGGR